MIPDPTPDDLKQDAEVRTLHDPACHFWLYHYEGHCTCGLRWESQLAHERKRAEAAERERDELRKRLAVIAKWLPAKSLKSVINLNYHPLIQNELIAAIHGEAGEGRGGA